MSTTVTITRDNAYEVRDEAAVLFGFGAIPAANDNATGERAKTEPVTNSTAEPAKPTTTRRTKAQIATDEKNAATAAAQQAITASPENRVGPEDDPVVDAQDAADEAAETTTTEYTHDDVKKALGAYVAKFGMPAAQEDGVKVLKLALGDKIGKISDIPTDQASLTKAVNGINEMLTKNPFKRDPIPPKA